MYSANENSKVHKYTRAQLCYAQNASRKKKNTHFIYLFTFCFDLFFETGILCVALVVLKVAL